MSNIVVFGPPAVGGVAPEPPIIQVMTTGVRGLAPERRRRDQETLKLERILSKSKESSWKFASRHERQTAVQKKQHEHSCDGRKSAAAFF